MESKKKNILIVDDVADNQIFLTTILKEDGYKVMTANKTSEGLIYTKERKPILIILNAMIPKEKGIQFYYSLKFDDNLKKIPVIMLSSIDKQSFFQCRRFQRSQFGHGLPRPEGFLMIPPETHEVLDLVNKLTIRNKE